MNDSTNEFETGLVLSGGAVRGFAHLGAIKAMNEKNIYPDIISGVSAGAIIGVFYADGLKPDEIFDLFSEKKTFEFMKLIFKRNGLLDMSKLKKVLRKNLKANSFEELKKPMYIAVTNFISGKSKYMNKGKLAEIIIASSSIPVLFKPVKLNDSVYVDGGLTNNMPIEPIKKKCKKIIGVHVNPIGETAELDRLHKIAVRSFHMSIASDVNNKKKEFDIFIEPLKLKDYSYFDLSKGKELFDIGYEEAKKVLEEHSKAN